MRRDWETRAAEGLGRVENGTSRVLFWGGAVSIVVAVAGLLLALLTPGTLTREVRLADIQRPPAERPAQGVFVAVRPILRGLGAGSPFDPLAVVALGLGLLLLTPVAGVLVALAGFLAVGDQLYAGIAALVLVILVVSLVTGGGHP